MKKLLTVLTVLFSMSFAGVALAEDPVAAPTTMGFAEVGLGLGGCQGDCDNVDPSVGISLGGFYNVMPDIAAGINFRYQMYGTDNGSLSSMMFSAEGRYYYPINQMVRAYGALALGYDKMTFEIDTPFGTSSGDDTAMFIQLGGGIEYAISPVMFVGGTLRYQLNFWDDNDGDFNDWLLSVSFGYRF